MKRLIRYLIAVALILNTIVLAGILSLNMNSSGLAFAASPSPTPTPSQTPIPTQTIESPDFVCTTNAQNKVCCTTSDLTCLCSTGTGCGKAYKYDSISTTMGHCYIATPADFADDYEKIQICLKDSYEEFMARITEKVESLARTYCLSSEAEQKCQGNSQAALCGRTINCKPDGGYTDVTISNESDIVSAYMSAPDSIKEKITNEIFLPSNVLNNTFPIDYNFNCTCACEEGC